MQNAIPHNVNQEIENAKQVLQNQFLNALYDLLWKRLCDERQSSLYFYNINQQAALNKIQKKYAEASSIEEKLGLLKDVMFKGVSSATLIRGIVSQCKTLDQSSLKKVEEDVKKGQTLSAKLAPLLRTFSQRLNALSDFESKSKALDQTLSDCFKKKEGLEEKTKHYLVITKKTRPECVSLPKKPEPIFPAIAQHVKSVYEIENDINEEVMILGKVKKQVDGVTSAVRRQSGDSTEFGTVDALFQAAHQYDDSSDAEKAEKRKLLENANQAFSAKAKEKDSSDHTKSKTLREFDLAKLLDPVTKESVNIGRSLSSVLIDDLYLFFDVVEMDAEEKSKINLYRHLEKGKKYRYGMSGSIFGGHWFGSRFGTLDKLLQAASDLDEALKKEKKSSKLSFLKEDIKRHLARLRARYPEKKVTSFDAFLARLDFPVTEAEKSILNQVSYKEKKLEEYQKLWDEAHKHNAQCDFDALPTGVALPNEEDLQAIVFLNLDIEKSADYQVFFEKIKPLFDMSKSLYYVVLQALVLAKNKKITEKDIGDLFNFIQGKEGSNFPASLENLAFSWPQIGRDRLKETEQQMINNILAESKAIVFPASTFSRFVAGVTALVSEVPKALQQETTTGDDWPEFYKELAWIQGRSENVHEITQELKQQLLEIKAKYPSAPKFALLKALVYGFKSIRKDFNDDKVLHEYVESLKLNLDHANSVHEMPTLSVIDPRVLSHKSDKRFVEKVEQMYGESLKESWQALTQEINEIKGNSQNFDIRSLKDLKKVYLLNNVFPEKNQNMVFIFALLQWIRFVRTDVDFSQFEKSQAQLKSYLFYKKDFPALAIPKKHKTSSIQRLIDSLNRHYQKALDEHKMQERLQKRLIVLGVQEAVDYKNYCDCLEVVLAEYVAPRELGELMKRVKLEDFTPGQSQLVCSAFAILRHYYYDGLSNKGLSDAQSDPCAKLINIFSTLKSKDFSIDKELKDQMLALVGTLNNLSQGVRDLLTQMVNTVSLKENRLDSPRMLVYREEDATKIMNDEERLASRARKFGYENVECGGEGDCFFLSVKDQLPGYEVVDLRKMVAEELREHRDYYESFFADHETSSSMSGERKGKNSQYYDTMDEWIEAIGSTREWADQLVCQALARKLKVTIVILSSRENSPPYIMKPRHATGKIILGNLDNWHYQSLRVRANAEVGATESLDRCIENAKYLDDYPLSKDDERLLSDIFELLAPRSMGQGGFNFKSNIVEKMRDSLSSLGEIKQNDQPALRIYCLLDVYLNLYSSDLDLDALINQRNAIYAYLQSTGRAMPDLHISFLPGVDRVRLNSLLKEWGLVQAYAQHVTTNATTALPQSLVTTASMFSNPKSMSQLLESYEVAGDGSEKKKANDRIKIFLGNDKGMLREMIEALNLNHEDAEGRIKLSEAYIDHCLSSEHGELGYGNLLLVMRNQYVGNKHGDKNSFAMFLNTFLAQRQNNAVPSV